MLQTMAYGGSIGSQLFENVSRATVSFLGPTYNTDSMLQAFAASPYLPEQYGYSDWIPSQSYYAFATYAGCFSDMAYGYETVPRTILECLRSKDTHLLQNASFYVSSSANYGIWGFLPVTDGVIIEERPSQQLLEKRINGQRLLIGVSNCRCQDDSAADCE